MSHPAHLQILQEGRKNRVRDFYFVYVFCKIFCRSRSILLCSIHPRRKENVLGDKIALVCTLRHHCLKMEDEKLSQGLKNLLSSFQKTELLTFRVLTFEAVPVPPHRKADLSSFGLNIATSNRKIPYLYVKK